jgi:small-conductance mechanosensitive channel
MLKLVRMACGPLVSLLLMHGALAQIPGLPSAATPAAAKPAESRTIPIADIAQRADEDEVFLQDVIQRSGASRATASADELAIITRNLASVEARIQGDRLAALPLANLETLDRYLRFLEREVRAWQAGLQQGGRVISEDAAEVVKRRRVWLETQTAIAGDNVPTLVQRIDALLKDFARAEEALSRPLAKQLALSREAGAVLGRVVRATSAVRHQIAGIDRKLWQRDTDGLWTALDKTSEPPTIDARAIAENLSAEAGFTEEFERSFGAAKSAAILLSVLTLPVFITLSLRARRAFATDPGLASHRLALTRPVSAWLLLSLATLVLIGFSGPPTFQRGLLVLAWLPIMRLQPEPVRRLLGGWIYLSLVFMLLNVFIHLLGMQSLLFRLLVLASSVLTLAALAALLLRLRRLARHDDNRRMRALRMLTATAAAANAIAVGANVVGNITLAAMLTEATLYSAYLGLFLLAASHVVRAWSSLVFRPAARQLQAGAEHAGSLLHVGSRLFDVGLFLVWLYGTLGALRVLRPLQDLLTEAAALRFVFGNLSITLGGTVLFCVSIYLSFWLAKTVRGVLAEDVLPRMTLPRGVANSASTMTYYLLLMLGLVVALAAAGFEVSQLAIVLGALSLGIGLGLQAVINNFVSGLILMFERPIQPGDTVELAGTVGTVRDIGMRSTTFTTFEGADVVVPNGMLLSEKLINWTLSSNTRRVDIPVGVAYGSDPAQVLGLLAAVADRTENVSRQPAPSVLFVGFGASSLDFSVRAWVHFNDYVSVRSNLGLGIHAALKEAGIEIPFPQQDLHLKTIDPGLMQRLNAKP